MEAEPLIELLDSQDFLKVATNASRLVVKLKAAIQKKELYETHQILRTVYFRFVNSRERVFVLLKLLHLGASYLLKQNEATSAQDIGGLILEAAIKCLNHRHAEKPEEAALCLSESSVAYHTSRNTLDLEICTIVTDLAVNLPDTQIGQQKYVAAALDSLTNQSKLLNASLLYNVMAETFWQHKQYSNSRYHYLHCASIENSKDVAAMLIEYQTENASKREVDLFITQFVFQFLCLQNPRDSCEPKKPAKKPTAASSSANNNAPANRQQKTRSDIKQITEKIFSSYTLNHPSLSQVCIPFASFPLLNFTYFIISTLDSHKEAATFKVLRDVYRISWSRDPNYQRYLDRIGTLYFGVADPNAQQRQGGFLNNILASLFEGTDEDEEDTEDQHQNSAQVCPLNLSSRDELD